ncbi:hypothetical protein GALL_495410 [mine drainage metagenome]|uniref:Uncharacterized protein n=1 Tax=mine drainage metagenome TaxID=410659 RepID=A0A1J5PBZ7_9ZZZZ
MPHHVIFDLDAVAAVHVAGHARDIERFAAIVALDDGNHLRRHLAFVHQAPDAQGGLQAQRNVGLHVRKLFLNELRRRERAVELLAVERVLPRTVHAVFRGPHRAPGNAVAGAVEAAERSLQAGNVGQQRALRHLHAFHHDFAGDGSPQAQLAGDLRSRKALHALLENESANLVVVFRRFRPHHEHVGDRRVGNPHLGTGQPVAVGRLLGASLHAAGIGPGIRLGQTETADPFAGGELRQIFLALVLVAIRVDRVHDQGRLHRIHRAIAGIDTLDLARDEAVGDVARIGAAIFLRQGDADQAEFAHLVKDVAIDPLFQIGLGDARQQLVLRIGPRSVADHALVFGELLVEHERIVPLETYRGRLVLGLRAYAHENSFRIIMFILKREAQKRNYVGFVIPGGG